MISKKMVEFKSWETWRSHVKGHGKNRHGISKAVKNMNSGGEDILQLDWAL